MHDEDSESIDKLNNNVFMTHCFESVLRGRIFNFIKFKFIQIITN